MRLPTKWQKETVYDNDRIRACAGEPNRYRRAETFESVALTTFEIRNDFQKSMSIYLGHAVYG